MLTDSFYQLPIVALAAMVAIVFVGSYWLGCFLLRPVLRLFVRRGGDENQIIGTALSAFGVFYGLLLSLIAVAAYQNLNTVNEDVADEASAMLALYSDVSELPEPLAGDLRSAVREYCCFAIDEEWPVQRNGRIPLGGTAVIEPIRQNLLKFEPEGYTQTLLHQQSITHFESMLESSRRRKYAAQTGIPSVMWYVVIVGTIINFALLWMFDMKLLTQLFLGGLIAFFLGALILLIAVLDRPYRSRDFGVSPEAFELVYTVIERSESGKVGVEGVQIN